MLLAPAGPWGKGFLNETQTKIKYVPAQDTDFFLLYIGQEMGICRIIYYFVALSHIHSSLISCRKADDLFSSVYDIV
jgi:cell division protein FtsW (lipid II flippase)